MERTQAHDESTRRWVDRFTKVGRQYLLITNDTPYYRRTIYAAKVLILMMKTPAGVSIDQPEERVFTLIEEVEFVVNYVTTHGLDTFGTNDTVKIHKALAKTVDCMEVVLRKSDSDRHKEVASSVKEKAESLITMSFVMELAGRASDAE